ncbi:MAG: YkgJ family cysteine cluster protein [Phycisphaerae bacterium]|jgi:Fe-S-cluster containining protein
MGEDQDVPAAQMNPILELKQMLEDPEAKKNIEDDSTTKAMLDDPELKKMLDLPVEEIKAKLGIYDDGLPEIANHAACQACRGLCCSQFQIHVIVNDETGLPDWDAQKIRVKGVPDSDFEFIKEHFKPIRQPGNAVFDASRVPVGSTDNLRWRHQLWFTCTAFKDGRCSKYDQRPQVCRIHLCSSAKFRGVNPELDIRRARPDSRWGNGEKLKSPYYYPEMFPAIEGPGDQTFVKPGFDCRLRQEENDERDKRLCAAIPERFAEAAKRAGITMTLDEYLDARDAADKASCVEAKAAP